MILVIGTRTNSTTGIIGIVQTEGQVRTIMEAMQTSSYWRDIYFLPLENDAVFNMARMHTVNYLLENPMQNEASVADDELLKALEHVGRIGRNG